MFGPGSVGTVVFFPDRVERFCCTGAQFYVDQMADLGSARVDFDRGYPGLPCINDRASYVGENAGGPDGENNVETFVQLVGEDLAFIVWQHFAEEDDFRSYDRVTVRASGRDINAAVVLYGDPIAALCTYKVMDITVDIDHVSRPGSEVEPVDVLR